MASLFKNPGVARAVALATGREARIVAFVLVAQITLLFGYLYMTTTNITSISHTLYPIAWVTLGVWLVVHLRAYGPHRFRPRLAAAVGIGYFLLLGTVGSTFGLSGGTAGTTVTWATPGWGPIVFLNAVVVRVIVVPFEVIGYLALSYGVYRAVAASAGGALSGLVGVFACVGCVMPILAALGGVFGGVAAALQPSAMSYGLATVIFTVTVGLLAVTTPTSDPLDPKTDQ